jgi:phosphohistidine phosphatase
MDLYLIRHAEAGESDYAKWPDDAARPLTAEGEKRFRRAAKGLRDLGVTVDVVLSSPWVRAWRTAELLEKEARWPQPLPCEALESGRAPAEVLQALQPFTGVSAIALVGHEPSLHELTSYLLTADTGHAQVEMGKGGVARLEIGEGLRPGSAHLRWLLTQKLLRAISN